MADDKFGGAEITQTWVDEAVSIPEGTDAAVAANPCHPRGRNLTLSVDAAHAKRADRPQAFGWDFGAQPSVGIRTKLVDLGNGVTATKVWYEETLATPAPEPVPPTHSKALAAAAPWLATEHVEANVWVNGEVVQTPAVAPTHSKPFPRKALR